MSDGYAFPTHNEYEQLTYGLTKREHIAALSPPRRTATMADLREKLARLICEAIGDDWHREAEDGLIETFLS